MNDPDIENKISEISRRLEFQIYRDTIEFVNNGGRRKNGEIDEEFASLLLQSKKAKYAIRDNVKK